MLSSHGWRWRRSLIHIAVCIPRRRDEIREEPTRTRGLTHPTAQESFANGRVLFEDCQPSAKGDHGNLM